MSASSRFLPWVLLVVAAALAAYGALVAYQLVHATFIAPGAFGSSFWIDALYVGSGVLAAGVAWGLLPQSTEDQLTVALCIPIRIAALAGFGLPVLTAGFRLIRRFLF